MFFYHLSSKLTKFPYTSKTVVIKGNPNIDLAAVIDVDSCLDVGNVSVGWQRKHLHVVIIILP